MGFSRQEYWSGLPFPSPGESSRPRDRTQVSCIAGRFFTNWATRESPKTPTTEVQMGLLGPSFNIAQATFDLSVSIPFTHLPNRKFTDCSFLAPFQAFGEGIHHAGQLRSIAVFSLLPPCSWKAGVSAFLSSLQPLSPAAFYWKCPHKSE